MLLKSCLSLSLGVKEKHPSQNWNCFLCTGFIFGEFLRFGALIYCTLKVEKISLNQRWGLGWLVPSGDRDGAEPIPVPRQLLGRESSPWALKNPVISAPGF